MRRAATGPPTIGDWLGVNGHWPGPDGDGTIEDYLLSHTRLIPRDIISLGNDLNEEVLRQKQAGHEGLPPAALQRWCNAAPSGSATPSSPSAPTRSPRT
jgi:hypothetical protein